GGERRSDDGDWEMESVDGGDSVIVAGRKGLDNLGNTCYANCIFQSLHGTTDFVAMVLRCAPSTPSSCLHRLQALFARMILSKRRTITPRDAVECCRPPWFTPGTQQDCSEFLHHLLDCVDEETSAAAASPDLPALHKLSSHVFGGELVNRFTC